MARHATYNFPFRLDKSRTKRKSANESLCKKERLDFLGVQEYTDACVAAVRPFGFGGVRPRVAQSAGLYYRKARWELLKSGWVRINSKGHPDRGILWARFRNRKTGKKKTIAVIHLVAFASSKPAAAREHIRQQRKVAEWLEKQPKSTVVMGDWNRAWSQMPDMSRVAKQSSPLFGTGPHGQKIDYAAKRRSAKNGARGLRAGDKAGSDHRPYIFTG